VSDSFKSVTKLVNSARSRDEAGSRKLEPDCGSKTMPRSLMMTLSKLGKRQKATSTKLM
jgi:hypothetical protein